MENESISTLDLESGISHGDTGTTQGLDRPSSLGDSQTSITGSTAPAEYVRCGTTQRGLKSRHAQMIALGGIIGTALFVGAGQTLALGGPAFILACFMIMTILVYFVVTAVTEVATYMPVDGQGMSSYGNHYVSKSMGFAMGYLYWYAFGVLIPYEVTGASLVINYWSNNINMAVWVTTMLVFIVGLNFLPVRYYGETEFWFAGTKIDLLVGLLILSLVLFCGGGPQQTGALGFHYWKDPGAVKTYLIDGNIGIFVAFVKTMVLSVFPFTFAPELLIMTGGEMESPHVNLSKASKRYFYRLIVFYCLSVLAIGCTCPSNAKALTDGATGAGSSPFVIAIQTAGITVLPSIVNAVIIISSWSAGNSFLYISSRSLYSLARQNSAPRIFKICSRHGVPYYAVAASSLFGLLAYLNCASSSSGLGGAALVFHWFVSLTSTSGVISWICCCIVYLRFYKAKRAQKIAVPYTSWVQPYGAWVALVVFTLLGLLNGFTVFFPSEWSVSSFLTAYIGIFIFIVIYLVHRVVYWEAKWAYDPREIKMRMEINGEGEQAEKPKEKRGGWRRILAIVE